MDVVWKMQNAAPPRREHKNLWGFSQHFPTPAIFISFFFFLFFKSRSGQACDERSKREANRGSTWPAFGKSEWVSE
jgi:hypothetical protein